MSDAPNPEWLQAYCDAYRRSVGGEPPKFQRRGGWWTAGAPGFTRKYRRSDLESATSRLLARAALKSPEKQVEPTPE